MPVLEPPSGPKPLGRRGLFLRRCYLLGITDPATVAELWAQELARDPVKKVRRRGRPR